MTRVLTTCSRCAGPCESLYGWCLPCLTEVGTAQRREQGLPDRISDPVVLRQVAAFIDANLPKQDAA